LEQHAPAAAEILCGNGVERRDIRAEDLDLARVGLLQPDDRPHQDRLAGSRTTDDTEDLASADLEVDVLVDDLLAETILQMRDADNNIVIRARRDGVVVRFGGRGRGRHQT
jgi:hypothetical protein